MNKNLHTQPRTVVELPSQNLSAYCAEVLCSGGSSLHSSGSHISSETTKRSSPQVQHKLHKVSLKPPIESPANLVRVDFVSFLD